MTSKALPAKPTGLRLMFAWPRVRFVLLFTLVLGSMIGLGWRSTYWAGLWRTVALGFVAMTVFGILEQWPKRLPRWVARWALQVFAVGFVMPFATAVIYAVTTDPDEAPFYKDKARMEGYGMFAGMGVFLVPWIALAALVRQKEALARNQALAFDLERSELEREASEARLRLLQAQVAPHFLFNTLANVQALVESGSPEAADVLRSLVAYLRAAVPRLDQDATTLGEELELVRAYLELMHMRMPDRLQFALHVEDAAKPLRCPPMTLLTLVENAVRHGIDPSEVGGRIDIDVRRVGARCFVRVADTGVGLRRSVQSLGTGLATLRERLRLAFGDEARLSVEEQRPRGVVAELDLPAREVHQ